MHIKYPALLDCSITDLEEEFRAAWKVLGPLWLAEINKTRKDKAEPNQLSVLQSFVSTRSIEFPYMAQLIQIMVATPPNTSPVERGYSLLQIVCQKRRGNLKAENIETLLLLAALKLKIKSPWDYKECFQYCN